MPPLCKICSNPLIESVGPPKSKLGILGDKPQPEDRNTWKVWTDISSVYRGPNVGRILRAELAQAGLFFGDFIVTNVWMHDPVEDEREYNWHLQQAIRVLRKCELILAMGSIPSQALIGENAGNVSGLWVKSNLFTDKKIMISPSPTILLRGSVGEFRLALSRFAIEVKKRKI